MSNDGKNNGDKKKAVGKKAKGFAVKVFRKLGHAERRFERFLKRKLGVDAEKAPKPFVHPWTLEDPGHPGVVDQLEKRHCCGCGSCSNACPKHAISMEPDEEGFLYPRVDHAICIGCGVCVRKCPVLTEQPKNDAVEVCYAQWSDEETRLASVSGGAFTELARYAFARGGVVFGAAYGEDMAVRHVAVEDEEGLSALRGSKYVQSQVGDCYAQVRRLLEQGRFVLFSGCPCQVAGLYAYLGKGDWDNLLTADLLCHGAPSQALFRRYLEEDYGLENVADVKFRDKSAFGWSSNMNVYLADGAVRREWGTVDPYYRMFSACLANRPFCSICKFSRVPRVGDFTLGDWWGIGRYDRELDDRSGTSLVMVNNVRARAVFDEISPGFERVRELPLDQAKAHNGAIDHPLEASSARDRFFRLLKMQPFDKAVRYTLGPHFDVGVYGLWYGENYGSVLTYFGLMKVLESMGLSACLLANPLGSEAVASAQEPVSFARRQGFYITQQRPLSRMGDYNKYCDAFLLGSDQLWNPLLCLPYGHSYFLDFADPDKKRIAYGTSVGRGDVPAPERYKEQSRWEFSKFDALSVRDDLTRDILRCDYGQEAEKVVDPAFLCDPEEYRALAATAQPPTALEGELPPLENGGYLFAYILDPDEETEGQLARIARLADKPIILALNMEYAVIDENEALFEGSSSDGVYVLKRPQIEQWLFAVAHSDEVLTDSFHGTIFAHVFGRNFVALPNAQRGAERFSDVLGILGLLDRMLPGLSTDPEKIVRLLGTPIDFKASNARLQVEREKSYCWLRDALFAPKRVHVDRVYRRIEDGGGLDAR